MRRKLNLNNGFTITELAIVIVVIALVASVLLIASSIIRQAKLQAVTNDLEGLKTAVAAFKLKYNYLPGDIPYAEEIWGTDPTCTCPCVDPSPTAASAVKKVETCNGNGDEIVGMASPDPFFVPYTIWEPLRALQHLANASFIKGTYSGIPRVDNLTEPRSVLPGENSPPSRLNNNTFMFDHGLYPTGDTEHFPRTTGNSIDIASPHPDYANIPIGGFVTTAEALAMDLKIDDGKPGTGFLITWRTSVLENCASSDDPAVAVYNIGWTEDAACGFMAQRFGFDP